MWQAFFNKGGTRRPVRNPTAAALGSKLKLLDSKDRAVLLGIAELLAARGRR